MIGTRAGTGITSATGGPLWERRADLNGDTGNASGAFNLAAGGVPMRIKPLGHMLPLLRGPERAKRAAPLDTSLARFARLTPADAGPWPKR